MVAPRQCDLGYDTARDPQVLLEAFDVKGGIVNPEHIEDLKRCFSRFGCRFLS